MTVSDAAVKAVVCYETDLNVNWLSPLAYQLHCTSQKLPSDRIKDTVIYQSFLLLYGVTSLLAALLHRSVMSFYFFDFPVAVLIVQTVVLLSVLEFASIYLSLHATEGLVMPQFASVKAFLPIAVQIASVWLYRRSSLPPSLTAAVVGLSFGCCLTNLLDPVFDAWSIIYGIAAIAMQAGSLIIFQDLLQKISFSELLYYNCFNSFITLLVIDIVQDEIRDSVFFIFTSSTWSFVICLASVVVMGIAVQCFTIACLQNAGALALCVVGSVRSALQVYFAHFFAITIYYDLAPGFENFAGLVMTIVCGAILAYQFYQNRLNRPSQWPQTL
ncbi:unnamed protein product [Enterobius vermicularis]|uniref:TPT domain-containing protein n=1 Tax=Enterobius vermicularis TaxID=51028 RepID=A0A0N4VF74_ENTVE|nr:unnamed protein product [Enterobius vermicularis]